MARRRAGRVPGVCHSWPLLSGWCPLQKECPRSGLRAREVTLRKFFEKTRLRNKQLVLADDGKERDQPI